MRQIHRNFNLIGAWNCCGDILFFSQGFASPTSADSLSIQLLIAPYGCVPA